MGRICVVSGKDELIVKQDYFCKLPASQELFKSANWDFCGWTFAAGIITDFLSVPPLHPNPNS
jgi:hypothetical protein